MTTLAAQPARTVPEHVMRAAKRMCRTVILRLRFVDYARATRSATTTEPTAQTDRILTMASSLLTASMPMIERRGVTLIGIALTNLSSVQQLQTRFNHDRGEPRLILIFSPT